MAQPALTFSGWQVATAVDNLEAMGVSPQDIILLWTKHDDNLVKKIESVYHTQNYVFPDNRPHLAVQYIPSVRPYLWWQFLSKYPEFQNEDFVYQDSDVIYRKIPNLNTMNKLSATHWYGGDTESYTGPDYMNSKGKDFIHRTANFLGITDEQFWSFKGSSVGAHWVISHPRASYWQDVFNGSYKLYAWVKNVEHEYDYVLQKNGGDQQYWFQVWVAEMIAEAYLCAKYGITTEKSPELAFSWSSDTIDRYSKFNILHNSGVTKDVALKNNLFFKGDYQQQSPFSRDMMHFNPDYCSSEYAKRVAYTAQRLQSEGIHI